MQAEEDFLSNVDAIPLVFLEFTDAYSFRNLIEYLNLTNDNGNFVFTPKEIYYCRQNDNQQILNEIIIRTHELTQYDYNSPEDNNIVGINLGQFKNAIRKVGKKDIARLSVFGSEICLKVVGSPKNCSDGDVDIIRTQRIDHEFFTLEGYQPEDEPNCTVSIQKFTSACSEQASCKDDIITVIGVEHGLILEARQGGNLRANIRCLGQIDETYNQSEKTSRTGKKNLRITVKYPNEITRHRIPRKIISALSKLTNISPNGTVKIYIQPDLPIKLSFHLSTYGILNVYLRSLNATVGV